MAINGRRTLYYIFQKKIMGSEQSQGYKVTYEEVSRDTRTLGTFQIRQQIDTVPTVTMSIPIDALPVDEQGLPETNLNNYRVLVRVTEDNAIKYGLACIVDTIHINYDTGVVDLTMSHRMAEMRQWVMPRNLVVKDMPFGHCAENVVKLGFPDDYVNSEEVLKAINYISFVTSKERKNYNEIPEGSATNHVQANYNSLSEEEKIYVPQEIPVTIEMDAYAYNTRLEMTFSSNNKLEALAEMLKNTKDLHFIGTISGHEMFYEPTNGNFGDGVKISKFDEDCDYSIIIAPNRLVPELEDCDDNPSDVAIIPMLGDPELSFEMANHFNRAAVFCGDIGDGILHLTLKELYENPGEDIDPKFPIGRYDKNINLNPEAEYDVKGTKINNEKTYTELEIPILANNDNREYFVTDLEQLADDNGVVYHTVYNFGDLYPIPDLEYSESYIDESGEQKSRKIELEITDDDRREITKRAYWRAIRFLKAQRPQRTFSFNTGALPPIDMVGKKVRFMYSRKITNVDDCGEQQEVVVANIDECFYITQRIITFDELLNETGTVTLDKELRPNTNEEIAVELSRKGGVDDETNDNDFEMGELYREYGKSILNENSHTDTPKVGGDVPPAMPKVPDTGIPKSH